MNPVHDKSKWIPINKIFHVNEFTYSSENTTDMPDFINSGLGFSGVWPLYMIQDLAIGKDSLGLPDNTTI